MMSKIEIGCCGAYCKTCPELKNGRCRGCKIGYDDGERDIKKAKCSIKVCCLQKACCTCADCSGYSTCETIQTFYEKKGYKYTKYRAATLFILQHGYEEFIKIADAWKNQYGKYK